MRGKPACDSRRHFLKWSVGAAIGTACGACALFRKVREPDVTVVTAGGTAVLPAADFPVLQEPGGSLAVEVEGMESKVLVFRTLGGSLSALSMTCTHMGCDVEFVAARDRIVCPCHGSEYAADGRVLKGPAELPLTRYAVSEEGGQIRVQVG